jgi:chromosome segregation ATPase
MELDKHVKSIKARLAEAEREVSKAQMRVRSINMELKDAMQQAFEQRLGVKKGDIITTKVDTRYFYERFIIDSYGTIYVLCHPVKNDGTASKAIRHMSYGEFIDCI